MQPQTLIVILIVVVLLGLLGVIAYRVIGESHREKSRTASLRSVGRYESAEQVAAQQEEDDEELIAAAVKKKKRSRNKEPTVDELLFMAGRLSQADRQAFFHRRRLAPLIFGGAGLGLGLLDGSSTTILTLVVAGLLAGLLLPMRTLRGWVKQQHEDLAYYLPLLIEQISIGVSSSLDIGPCIAQLVQMADERNSHNATTDLLKYALFYVKSGVSLEHALTEIGQASGQHEFKQALLALAQVAKFGGEVSKQLQELADAVGSQREAKIETEIRKLELKATGPVSLVFLAYVMLLGLGIVAQIMAGTQT
jgi:Flp pilus assembly protein TadB